MATYVPLDIQSSYSIGKSICTIPKLVKKARDMGLPAIALSDRGFMFGAVEFHNECRRLGGAYGDLPPIKPIIGLMLDVFGDGAFHKLRLLAKNATGYHSLVRIASEGAMLDSLAKHPVDFKTIEKWHEGLICLTKETDAALVERCMALFGEDFAFEAKSDTGDFSAWPSAMVCAASPVRYVNEDDTEAFEVNIAIRADVELADLPMPRRRAPGHLLTFEEMAGQFPSHPEWIENTLRLAERIVAYDLDEGLELLAPTVPEGFADRMEFLRHLAYDGARSRWGDPLPEDVAGRLEYELSVVGSRGKPDAAAYFLFVRDYVDAARRMGIMVGPGRGSAAGSALAYALGITDIDPLKHGLLFERFLNPDNDIFPDIDIDFDEDGRDKVVRHLVGKYGEDSVAGIVTFGVSGPPTAIKDVAKALDFPKGRGDDLASLAWGGWLRPTWAAAMAHSEELRNIYESGSGRERRILHIAEKLSGCVRTADVHACGFVVSACALTDILPVMAVEELPFGQITQYDGRHVGDVGLVKFDILGLKALSDQRRCIGLVRARTGEAIDLSRIPEEDAEALSVFARGDTDGIFQFDSEGIREVLRALGPTCFADLVVVNALYRPGVMDRLEPFTRRKHGEEPPTYLHPLMEDVLAETYGLTIFQEQFMLLAQTMAGFSRGESDFLRKALGKKRQNEIDEFRVKFVNGCLANPKFRIGEWSGESAAAALAEKVFRDWEEFAICAFNKSHAACYALVAYRSAYLKAHWPREFSA